MDAFRKMMLRALMMGPGALCPVCLEQANDTDDLHHALVKRSALPKTKHDLIRVRENLLFCHHSCHMQHGQARATTVNSLALLCQAWGCARIGEWYKSLWDEHGLPLAKGMLVPKRALPSWRTLEYFNAGLEFCGEDMARADDPCWMVKGKSFPAMVGIYWWQGSKIRGYRPPDSWAGVHRQRVEGLMDEGYWLEYLQGVFGVEGKLIPRRIDVDQGVTTRGPSDL